MSKNKYKLNKEKFQIRAQWDNGDETPGHRDNGSIRLRGHTKINGYVQINDNGIFCAIGPSYRSTLSAQLMPFIM